MAFTAADVKNLREMTGVGMMDCKKALSEADGDFDKAIEWLREKGLAAQTKKAGKIAAEGVSYAIVADNGVGVAIEKAMRDGGRVLRRMGIRVEALATVEHIEGDRIILKD